ncbi:CLUMA_CG019901, isoform A [Clunio marinus]|uniref:CLUMA_CG019901, isoform A n=1 Tax=Clunio marinus TaxID=568069 RepID=A0A1J1J2T2_9DIPT|nr:CLUMA_CG019901, isoform A [Clunio marinus]
MVRIVLKSEFTGHHNSNTHITIRKMQQTQKIFIQRNDMKSLLKYESEKKEFSRIFTQTNICRERDGKA